MGGFFFFQAEDGIRDLVRSRGLGDVYKRQELVRDNRNYFLFAAIHGCELVRASFQLLKKSGVVDRKSCLMGKLFEKRKVFRRERTALSFVAVSYTHLTLPTSDLV